MNLPFNINSTSSGSSSFQSLAVTVVGSGYVGLVTAACLAYRGHLVTCLDINEEKIEGLKKGNVPIFEPHLEEMVQGCIRNKSLHFTTDYKKALKGSSIVILAVDTPPLSDGKCDLTNIKAASRSLAASIVNDVTIVIKSTVPVGTSNLVLDIIHDCIGDRYQVDLVSNPEFLREGAAVSDCLYPDRIILGVPNKHAELAMRKLYEPFNHRDDQFIVMDPLSSELTKYASNTMLANRISFMNWLSNICDKIGADIESIRDGVGADSRIGPEFLRAGVGYGGSCFPKDVKALISTAKEFGCQTSLLEAIDGINEQQKQQMTTKVSAYFRDRGGIKGKNIAVLGLAFNPKTDDMREAPSITIIKGLLAEGCHVRLFDPAAMENAKQVLPTSSLITWCNDQWEALDEADALILCTDWNQFLEMDPSAVLSSMSGRAFFDGKNCFSPQEMSSYGFDYISIGRPPCYGSLNLVENRIKIEESLQPR